MMTMCCVDAAILPFCGFSLATSTVNTVSLESRLNNSNSLDNNNSTELLLPVHYLQLLISLAFQIGSLNTKWQQTTRTSARYSEIALSKSFTGTRTFKANKVFTMAVRAFQTLDFRNIWIEFTRVNDKFKGNEVVILVTYVALCVCVVIAIQIVSRK